ncbi:hypothetical protein TMLG_01684, partial [Mycobacterium tuberculosis SUMu012]
MIGNGGPAELAARAYPLRPARTAEPAAPVDG